MKQHRFLLTTRIALDWFDLAVIYKVHYDIMPPHLDDEDISLTAWLFTTPRGWALTSFASWVIAATCVLFTRPEPPPRKLETTVEYGTPRAVVAPEPALTQDLRSQQLRELDEQILNKVFVAEEPQRIYEQEIPYTDSKTGRTYKFKVSASEVK